MRKSAEEIVVLAGSGRSGTTWLGSILDSYERAEYFFETPDYFLIDLDSSDLLKLKHPLTFWLKERPHWISHIERRVLRAGFRLNLARRVAEQSLRIQKNYNFKKYKPNTNVFKIVTLLSFASNTLDLATKFSGNMKVVHIIRNPFSYVVSELRNQSKNLEKAKKHFKNRLSSVKKESKLSEYFSLVMTYENGLFIEHIALLLWISNELMIKDKNLPCHRVTYERLCRNPYEEVEKIFRFLQWPMTNQTSKHIERTTNSSLSESGIYSIFKNPSNAMNHWRREIVQEDYKRIERLLRNCSLLDLWDEKDLLFDWLNWVMPYSLLQRLL